MHTRKASSTGSDERGNYEIQLLSGANVGDALAKWPKSPAQWTGTESLFQSSVYFDFLLATEERTDLGVALVASAISKEIFGVIPVRKLSCPLKLAVGKRVFAAFDLKGIEILGSPPTLPAMPQLFDELAELLMHTYQDADVLTLESVPVGSWLWRHINTSKPILDKFHVYVPYGARQWYSLALPLSFKEYQKRFSAKHRYNLARQARRLRAHGGGVLNLRRIDSEEHVEELMAGMRSLATAQQHVEILRPDQFVGLAQRGVLLSYMLVCGKLPCAIAFGTHHGSVLQVHALFYDLTVWSLSPGTTLQHMLIQELIETGKVSRIEFGYGPGTASTSSENDATAKGHVFLMRKTPKNLAKKMVHGVFTDIVAGAKSLQQRLTGGLQRIAKPVAARAAKSRGKGMLAWACLVSLMP